MARTAHIPPRLALVPFRGSVAVAEGLITWAKLRSPAWRRLLPDVYLHHDVELDHRGWCEAVALTLPTGAAFGGLSAAYLWGVDLLPRDAPVTVMVPRTRQLCHRPRRVVQHTTLTPADVTSFSGIPVTTPERTTFDLARQGPRTEALIAVDAMLHHRLVKLEALQALADERRHWPGAHQLNDVFLLAEPLTESPMETRLRLLLIDAGAPSPTAQHRVYDRRGTFVARVDLAWPELRLAIEYEGDHHRERAQFRRDVGRLNALRAAGWTVLRFTADDVLRHPRRTVMLIAAAMRQLRRSARHAI